MAKRTPITGRDVASSTRRKLPAGHRGCRHRRQHRRACPSHPIRHGAQPARL